MQAAEDAVWWAKRPSRKSPLRSNYAQLLEDVCKASSQGDTAIILQCHGMAAAHWPCLSRLLIMDVPELAEHIHPRYIRDLDEQAGNAWLRIMFTDVTNRQPAVTSWRHAPRRGAVAL